MEETRRPRFLSRGFRFSFTLAVITTLVLMLGVFSGRLAAQVQTSTVTGTVTDPSGAVIVGATVELTQGLTGATRTVTSDASGNFTFTNVLAGTYSLRITQSGFQTYNRTGMVLAAAETLSLHRIALAVGATATQVTVTAEAARVETQSSSQAGLVSESQITNIPNKGRNYMDYLTMLPGTVGSAGGSDAPGWGQGRVTFNGGDSGTVLVLLNGIASQDTGAPGAPAYISPSTDSVAEERVHTGVEDAQFGGRAGGTVDVVTKNGTSQFHGDLYWFNRNNFYNANDYFRKLNGISQPAPYKFNDVGGTIGGPILIPGTGFNSSRQRAFFFFSLDTLHRTISGGTTNVTMPTPGERAGIFSNLTQPLVNPYNPSASPSCVPGASSTYTCTFPSAAKDTAGSIILNALPLPTCLRAGDNPSDASQGNSSLAGLPACANNNSNYHYTNSYPDPWHNDVLRTDFKLSNNELFYVVAGSNREERQGFTGFLGGNGNWPQSLTNYLIRSRQLMGSLISTLGSTVVNEVTLGTNYALQSDYATTPDQLTKNNRAALGLTPTVLPVLFPDSNNGGYQSPVVNEHNLIPNITFGGTTNLDPSVGGSSSIGGSMPSAPAFSFESRYPFFGTDWDWTFTDNLSWVKGNHNTKFGIFYEHVSRSTATYSNRGGSQFNGVLDFTSNGIYCTAVSLPQCPAVNAGGSPFDTGNTFANAYVGAFTSYSEDNTRWVSHGINHDLAWFAQDNWRVTSRLTLDLGMRFTIMVPDFLRNGHLLSEFQPFLYDFSAQPKLIMPEIATSGPYTGLRAGVLSDGSYVAPSAIGLYDPTTYSGSVPPYSGMLQTDGLVYRTPKIGLGPRFGFAWDVLGNGKTAVRGGFGIFFDRTGGIDDTLTKADQPPMILSPFLFNSTIQQVLSSGTGQTFLGPQDVEGPQRLYSQPQTYNTHLDIQQDLTHGILLDVGYASNLSRHFQRRNEYNSLPYGERFQSKYQDPTTGSNYIDNIVRCLDSNLYCGYARIRYSTFDENANYNAMEVTLTKRFGANFNGGASYTWSKVLDYSACCNMSALPYLPGGAHYYYGPGGNDRRQNLTVNWHYNLPSPFQNAIAKETLNGWSLEGVASFISGGPATISASYHGDPSGSNSGSGSAPVTVNVSGNVVKLQKTASGVYYLNPSAVTAATNGPTNCQLNDPTTCGLGNASSRDIFTGPGTNNWNVSLLKKFPLGSNESRYLQFRWETYNTFNHPQFSGPGGRGGTRASFNSPGGGPVTNGSFGQITGLSVPARIQVLALKLYF